MSDETIGIIAGEGQFPFLAAREARASGLRVAAVGFTGFTDPALAGEADEWKELHLGQLGKLISFFKKLGVRRFAFAGSINKPKALDLRPDFRAAKLLFKLKNKGDDALLRAVTGELESEGLVLVQAADLIPTLRAPEGVLTKRRPTAEEREDLRYGLAVAREIGRLDIGQCLVVKSGMVVAVEALEGTDATLLRGGKLGGPGCVAVKTLKPGQDERVDLPAMGLQTVDSLIEAGILCLGYQAGKTIFFNRSESVEKADASGICLVGLPEDFS